MGEFVKKDKQNPKGKYPVYNGGSTNTGYYDEYNTEANKVIISARGAAGFVNYVDMPFWAGNSCHVITVTDKENLDVKYLYYYLKEQEQDLISHQQKGGGVPAVSKKQVESILLPLPPLPIQQQIVSILDKFSQLSAELEAELELRKKQYDYYRNRLLSFDPASVVPDTTDGAHAAAFLNGNDAVYHKGYYPLLVKEALEAKELSAIPEIKWVKLGEIATIVRGGNFQKKDFVEEGRPCIHYGQIYTHYGTSTDKTIAFVDENTFSKSKKAAPNDIVMAVTSENVEDCCKAVAWLGNEEIAVSGHAAIIKHNQNAKYLSYYFHTAMFAAQKEKLTHGTKVIEVTPSALADITIPLPPLPIQQRIVSILDKFEQLTMDLQDGLPAEIRLVRRQYEYYRTRLLTFDKN